MAIAGIARNILAVSTALIIGYVTWLVGVAVIILATPVSFWPAGGAVVLAAVTVGSLALSRRQPAPTALFAYAPILPAVTSVYLLLCLAPTPG
jgi:hypothetical protein